MNTGKIEVYTGPMKSGKTTMLITKYLEIKQLNRYRVKMFKPSIDTRFGEDFVVCRNDIAVKATNTDNIVELLNFTENVDIFFIDEFQFLSGDLKNIQFLLGKGKSLYISGLNLTAEGKPFGLMGELLCNATKVVNLKGICDRCTSINGIYTGYIGKKTIDIKLGDSEYQCLCPKCYMEVIQNE